MSRSPVENEDVSGTSFAGQDRDLEESLCFLNLRQESQYLYEDMAIIRQKNAAQLEDLSQQLNQSKSENEQLKEEKTRDEEVIKCLSQENADLKMKLSKLEHIGLMFKEATGKLSRQSVELELSENLVKKLNNESRQFKEQAEVLTQDKDNLNDRLLEANELIMKTQRELEDAQRKLETMATIYDLQESALRQERAQKHRIERMMQTLLSSSSGYEEEEVQDGRFRLVQNNALVECSKCRVHCDLLHLKDTTCTYHPSKPIHPLTWKILFPDRQDSVPGDHFYWPCCDVFSRVEPEGCHVEARHDFDH